MKKLLTILITFTSISFCYSQVFNGGAILGLNATDVLGDGYGGNYNYSFIVGGFTNMYVSKKWSTQFEINYTQKGSYKRSDIQTGDETSLKLKFNYIEIPLAIRFQTIVMKDLAIFETGFSYGRLLNESLENQNGTITKSLYTVKNYDLNWFIGTSQILLNKIDNLSIHIRYKISIIPFGGFNNLGSNNQTNSYNKKEWYNSELNIFLSYQFGK
jgi:hypothetical protein